MGLRDWLKRIERDAREGYLSFQLRDGSTYHYDPREVGLALFVYGCDLDPDTEEPEFVSKVKQARDPIKALEPFRPRNEQDAWFDPIVLIEDIPEAHEDSV